MGKLATQIHCLAEVNVKEVLLSLILPLYLSPPMYDTHIVDPVGIRDYLANGFFVALDFPFAVN